MKRSLRNCQHLPWMQTIWQTVLMKKQWRTPTALPITTENTKRMSSIPFQEVSSKCVHKEELLLVIQLRLINWIKEYLRRLDWWSFIAMHFKSFCINRGLFLLNWLVQSYTEPFLWSYIHQVSPALSSSTFVRTNKFTTNLMKNIPQFG